MIRPRFPLFEGVAEVVGQGPAAVMVWRPDRWRAVRAPRLVVLIRAGATFINGKLTEGPGEGAAPEAA